MSALTLLPIKGTHAVLLLSTANLDTVLEATVEGAPGNLVSLTAMANSASGDGVVFTPSGAGLIVQFEDGVSTVADFEAALEADPVASAVMRVKTPGTPASVLVVTDDEFGVTLFTGGSVASKTAPTLTDATLGEAVPFFADEGVALVRTVNGSGTLTATVTIWGFAPATQVWYKVKTLNAGSAIAETTADAINYAETVTGLRRFSRLYSQLATGGTGPEVEVVIDLTPSATATA